MKGVVLVATLGLCSPAGVRSTGPMADQPARDRVEALNLYVATDGNDVWSGRLAAPSAGRTDGPFATWPLACGATST